MAEEFTVTGWVKLGGLVRDARLAKGLSQAALASRADVARSWLARVEAGHRGAELEPLFRLLSALDLTLVLRPNADAQRQVQPRSDQADAVPAEEPKTRRDSSDEFDTGLRAASEARRAAWGLPVTGARSDGGV